MLSPTDWPEAFHIQADAFSEDPLMTWLLGGRDQRERERRFHGFLVTYAATRTFRDNAEVHAIADGGASAIWMRPPGHFVQPVGEQLRMLPGLLRILGRSLPRALGFLGTAEKQHPADLDHWYLLGLATRRDRQGQGLGGLLLRFGLEHVDAERMPAYLESSNPRNISLYERHGFRVTKPLDLPAGAPPVTAMWRDGAAPGGGAG